MNFSVMEGILRQGGVPGENLPRERGHGENILKSGESEEKRAERQEKNYRKYTGMPLYKTNKKDGRFLTETVERQHPAR